MELADMVLDKTDREILRLLLDDGRMSHEQIAREVHLSRPAVHERVRKLEAAGVLRGYRAEVDWSAAGYPISAFVWVETAGSCQQTGREIWAMSQDGAKVMGIHRVVGEWCLLVEVRAAQMNRLEKFLDDILDVPHIVRKMTTLSLAELRPESGERAGCDVF